MCLIPGSPPLSLHSPHRHSLSALFIGPSTSFSSARFSRRPTCPDASVAGSLPTPPVPRHRKSHSLGNKWVMHWAPRALEGLSVGPGLTGWPAGALPPHRGVLTDVLAIPARCPLLRLAQGQEEVGGACTAHTRYWWGGVAGGSIAVGVITGGITTGGVFAGGACRCWGLYWLSS